MRISDWSSDVCSSDLQFALLEGKLRFRGEERAIDTLDLARPDVSADFLDYVHRFAWLRDLSSVAPRAQAAPIAENLMRRWLHAHADTIADPAWRPALCARRLHFWAAHAPPILSSKSEEPRVGTACVGPCR